MPPHNDWKTMNEEAFKVINGIQRSHPNDELLIVDDFNIPEAIWVGDDELIG